MTVEHTACWKYWDCSKESRDKCPVYKEKDGKRCWMYTHGLTPFVGSQASKHYKSCTECPWYKKIQSENLT